MEPDETIAGLRQRIAELEAALAKAERHNHRLESVIDNAPGVMWESEGTFGGPDYRITHVNSQVERIFGYTREEWMASPTLWVESIPAEDRVKVFQAAPKATTQGGAPAPHRVIKKDGTEIWVEPHLRIVRGPDGEILGRSAFMLDITERRRAQEARDALMRRIDNVIASFPGAVWEAASGTAQGILHIKFVSPFITSIIGYLPEEMVDHPEIWSRIGHPDEREAVFANLEAICEAGGGVLRHRWITKDSRIVWVETHIRITPGVAGAPPGACGVTMDITDRVLAELAEIRHKDDVIKAQAAVLVELGAPLIPISSEVLVMPLIGGLDPQRSERVIETLLRGIARSRARVAIIDITGVPRIDANTADALIRAALAVRLLGAEVVLTGMRPEVARTLVSLDARLEGIVTRGTLESGIAYATRYVGRPAR